MQKPVQQVHVLYAHNTTDRLHSTYVQTGISNLHFGRDPMVAWNWNLQIHSKTEIEEFDLHFMVLGLHLPLLLERILIDLYEEVQFGQ